MTSNENCWQPLRKNCAYVVSHSVTEAGLSELLAVKVCHDLLTRMCHRADPLMSLIP